MSEKRAIKRCYYEVLGVERDASDEEIRKSYKVLALKFHPDKNLDNSDDAAKFFREVQAAYEVLSNPKERCWYDRHREALLSGADKDSIEDFNFDILPYFTSSCYSGYDDSESGFYTVYREVFDEIVKEDTPYYEDGQEGLPSFGNSNSPFEDVHAFYSHWESYATPKTYSFLDEYNTVEAPNRRVARLMEKENKKVRDAAKKKRNEEIRTLVAFVRRRDKRVQAQRKVLEKQREEKRQKSAEHRKKQLEARNKELEAEAMKWAIMDDLEQELKEIEEEIESKESESRQKRKKKNKNKNKSRVDDQETGGQVDSNDKISANQDQVELNDDNNSEDEESGSRELEDSELYCMACDKLFKSVKTFRNHEDSKKHKANLVTLKQILEQEEQLLLDSDTTKS